LAKRANIVNMNKKEDSLLLKYIHYTVFEWMATRISNLTIVFTDGYFALNLNNAACLYSWTGNQKFVRRKG